jgi:long-chain acyl-CoA synthetase
LIKVDYPQTTMYQCIREIACKLSYRAAYEFMGRKSTFGKFLEQIDSAAAAYLNLGVRQGDKVALCLPNCPQMVISLYALNRIGAVAVMLNPLTPPLELARLIDETECQGFLALDILLPNLSEMLAECQSLKFVVSAGLITEMSLSFAVKYSIAAMPRLVRMICTKLKVKCIPWNSFKEHTNKILPPEASDPYADAVMLVSGGTSGQPKIVVHSSMSMNSSAVQSIATEPPIEDNMSFLAVLPGFHIFGLTVSVHIAFMAGTCCILVPRFNPELVAKHIIESRPAYMAGVPLFFEDILQSRLLKKAVRQEKLDMSGFRVAFCGGDKLPESTQVRFNQMVKDSGGTGKLVEGYGLTECCPVTLTPQSTDLMGSIGIAFPGIRVSIVKPGTAEEVGIGEEGEICINAPSVMKGYLNNPEDTSKALRMRPGGSVWLHTGDIGVMDQNGYVYFRDRLKRLIKVSGYTVFAVQVEEALESHPDVEKACVIGLPDPRSGHQVKAFVVLQKDCNTTNLERKLTVHCCERLIPCAVPAIFEFRKEIPLTQLGKVAWGVLENEENMANNR